MFMAYKYHYGWVGSVCREDCLRIFFPSSFCFPSLKSKKNIKLDSVMCVLLLLRWNFYGILLSLYWILLQFSVFFLRVYSSVKKTRKDCKSIDFIQSFEGTRIDELALRGFKEISRIFSFRKFVQYLMTFQLNCEKLLRFYKKVSFVIKK